MPDATQQFERKLAKFACAGVDIHTPVDLLPPGKYSRLLNVRGTRELGSLTCRPGLSAVNATPLDTDAGIGIHSIRRLNDNIGDSNDWVSTFVNVIGCGQRVSIIDATGNWTVFIPPFEVTPAVWSGRPLSLTPWRPNNSPRTWMYVWDADRQAKIGRDEEDAVYPVGWQMRDIGITPPNDPPTSTAGAGSYQYTYRYRDSRTGAKSNPAPRTLSTYASGGTLTATASTDPQVNKIDFFRFGGALLEWFYIGSAENAAPTFVDNVSDADAQLNEILDDNLDQPFTVSGLPLSGTCTVAHSGGLTTVTWATGDQFIVSKNGSLLMKAGTIVELDGKPYPMYRATNSATVIVVEGDATGATRFTIQNPVMQSKSLPFVWGPFQSVMFACGDVLNPGNLYWTNPNDPDSASALNVQEVTTPSEPLLNGFTHDGRCYVFSSERLFAVYPNISAAPDGTIRWEILETPCQRGMWTNWCYCTTGEKQGGGFIYFLSRDGIYRTQGGGAENITDADLYELFPHEGDNTQGVGAADRGLLAIDMTQRTYLRLSYHRGYLYFDYKDSAGTQRTLVYDEASNAWYPDLYTPGLTMHYGEEGREAGRLLAGSDSGVLYTHGTGTDNGASISCVVRTRSEDMGAPSVQKLFGDVQTELSAGDQDVTVQVYYNNEVEVGPSATYVASSPRLHRILDLTSGGDTRFNLTLELAWTNIGQSAVLYSWMPSAAPKPEDTQRRPIEWHEFVPGIPDAYVTGVRLWVDTRDLGGTPQTKTIEVWSDQANTGNTLTVNSNGEQDLIFSWPVFKGKLGRLLPTDTNRCRILRWEWMAENEPPLIGNWDTNWQSLGERTAIAYITGVIVVGDTQGVPKALTFDTEFEGTVTSRIAATGNSFQSNGRTTRSYSFEPFRAEQVRIYSHDNVLGRFYTWEWVTHFVEPRYLANWDATYQWFEQERLIKGVRLDADTIGMAKTVNVELDGVVYTTFTVTHTGRQAVHYDMPLDVATNEYPRARMARLYPTDTNAAFLYSNKWFADEEPPRLANWNARWEDGGELGAKWLQGFVLDADTAGAVKTVIVEYYPEGSGSAITVAGTFDVVHSGRGGKAYALAPPVVAHKFRLRPTDVNQRWLYGVKWVWEPHPERVRHWETQGYAHGLPSYQHRREGFVAYESTDLIYWIQNIDGVEYAIAFPATGGTYRKVWTPCLPIKGKLIKDTLRCSLPEDVPLVYTASLSEIEDLVTDT